jgi:hypothetical protein
MSKVKEITIPQLKIQFLELELIGDTPLIMHKWSEKAKKQIEDKQQKKAKAGRDIRDPEQEFKEAMYLDSKLGYCFPANAFKCASVRAGTDLEMKMSDLKRAFFVEGEFVKIDSDKPFMRTDPVRIGMGSTDFRYRPQFNNWKTKLTIKYNSNVISDEQIINLFNVAGFGVGIGEMRPTAAGGFNYGCFHVKNSKDK